MDSGVSVNLVPLSTLNAMGISQGRIQGSPMGITGFGGTIDHTIGHTKLVLKFGPFVRLLRFHVIDSTVSCLALLGRPWMHKYKLVLSIYHQCVEGLLDEKPIHIPHNDTPFDQAEANLLEVAIYNQLFISGEDATARPRLT